MKERKKRKTFLTIYTVSRSGPVNSGGISHAMGTDHDVVGSYIHRGDAIRACADDIIEALENNPRLRVEMMNDTNYDVRAALADAGISDKYIDEVFENTLITDLCIDGELGDALRAYLVDEIGSEGCYIIGAERFDVDENDVECRDGLQLWTCITSGRDDEDHDPQWEEAFPEVFFMEKDAVERAIDDLKACLEGYSREAIRAIVNEARERLAEDGHFKFDLNDSKQRIWDIWSTPIDIGQGCGKIQRR